MNILLCFCTDSSKENSTLSFFWHYQRAGRFACLSSCFFSCSSSSLRKHSVKGCRLENQWSLKSDMVWITHWIVKVLKPSYFLSRWRISLGGYQHFNFTGGYVLKRTWPKNKKKIPSVAGVGLHLNSKYTFSQFYDSIHLEVDQLLKNKVRILGSGWIITLLLFF